MLFNNIEPAIYFATDDGQIRMMRNIYGDKEPNITDVVKVSQVAALNGEPCGG